MPVVIKGADRRTKSEVQFGDPDEMTKYYQTTMNDHFRSNDAHKPPAANLDNYKSCIPLDYYSKNMLFHIFLLFAVFKFYMYDRLFSS